MRMSPQLFGFYAALERGMGFFQLTVAQPVPEPFESHVAVLLRPPDNRG